MILTINFAYLRLKDGTSRALSQDQSDAIAILEASDALRKRWSGLLKIFREERRRIDFIFRIYYPVYLVRHEGKMVAVDGMGLQESYFNEDRLEDGMTLYSRVAFRPVFGANLCNWLERWPEAVSKIEEIRNGFALPPEISKEEAENIAIHVKRVYDLNLETVKKLENEISEMNEVYNKDLLGIYEEQKTLLDNFDKKISLKSAEIEGLETYSEMKMIKEVKANFVKKLESIKKQKAETEKMKHETLKKISELEDEKSELLSLKSSTQSKISSLNLRLEKLNDEFQKFKSLGSDPKAIRNNLIDSGKTRRELESLQKDLEGCASRFNQISKEISRLKDGLDGLERQLANLNEKESLLSSKQEEEVNEIRFCFASRRGNLVKELLELTEEKEKALTEIKTRERQIRAKFKKDICRLHFLLDKSREDLKALESILIDSEKDAEWKLEMLLIPFYVYSIDGNSKIIEPQIHIKVGGKVERSGGTCLVQRGLDYLQSNWDVLSTLLFKAKQSFNLLSFENRKRIILAAESLRSMRVINDLQLSYIRAVEAK